MWAAAVAAAALISPDPLVFRSQVRVTGDLVRLGDVADLSPLPEALRDRAASTPVARIGTHRQVLSSRLLSERARAAMPALSTWLPSSPDRPVDVEPIAAPETPTPSTLAAKPYEPDINPGDTLTMRVAVGSVVVEREVHALQSGRRGHPVFVRTAEGRVLSAPVADDQ